MKSFICFENIWADDDMFELKSTTNDGENQFTIKTYVGFNQIAPKVKQMSIFRNQVHGGIFDLEFGTFGPEYGSGAISIRFQYLESIKLFITVHMQSDFFDFGNKNIAKECFLYLKTEPVLFDNFIKEISHMDESVGNSANLECLGE